VTPPAQQLSPAPEAPAAPAVKFWELDTRTSTRWSEVSGPGRSSSFYNDGVYTTVEPDLLIRKDYRSGWSVAGEFRPRATGDNLSDAKGLSVEALSLEVKNSSHVFNFGDHFASFSQYSMSQMLKGAGYQHNMANEENYFRAAVGSFDSQWEYLHSEDSNENMNRLGGGARAQFSGESYRLGLNWAFVKDNSRDSVRTTTMEDAYSQLVRAVDWEYRFGLFMVDGEHAALTTVRAPLTGEKADTGGHANKLRLQGTALGTRLTAGVENVSPDFLPLAGSASQDRRKYLLQLSRRLSRVWQAFFKFALNHDDLGGSHALTRTTNTTYDTGVTRTRLFGRRQAEASFTWRRNLVTTHSGVRENTVDRLQFTVSDQVSRATRVRATFEPTIDKDEARGKEAANYLYELRVSDRRRLPASWTLNSTLSGRRRETENQITIGYDLQNGLSARAELSRPGGLQTGLEYDYTEINVHTGTDSRTVRARAFFGMKPWEAASLDLDLGVTRYDFTDGTRAYNEKLARLNFNWRM
jgi:hypothetical protein